MRFKIDTKEVFHVITIEEKALTAIMAAELEKIIKEKQEQTYLNLILNFQMVEEMDATCLSALEAMQTLQAANGKSFVVCAMSNELQGKLGIDKDFSSFQITPTESEAWDIVQMEEIERELGLDI
ncbi:MAG: STAS domain-containing protein [Bacteroidota bacterium]|jgi:anti-anti-sigma regulatory factor